MQQLDKKWKPKENLRVEFEKIHQHCNILSLENRIFDNKTLTDLDLSNSFLKELPSDIKNLLNLKSLNLSCNNLTLLPKALSNLHQLVDLKLNHNKFNNVPEVLYWGLKTIKLLDLSFNEIQVFNNSPGCLYNITIFQMSHNALTEVPPWIFDSLCYLKILDLSQNPIKFNGKLFFEYNKSGIFDSLKILHLENCNFAYDNLQFLPYLSNMEILNIGNKARENIHFKDINYLGNLKMDIFKNLNSLKCLDMKDAFISMIPHDINCLKNITYLNLSDNLLTWLPENFCDLVNLSILIITSNQLICLPKNISKLKNLKQLHLSNNKLIEVPDILMELTCLEFIDLYNNKISQINISILDKKNLKGLDFGLNCININLINSDSENSTFDKKYNHLKNCFRKEFNLINVRKDTQNSDPGYIHESRNKLYTNEYEFNDHALEDLHDLQESLPNIFSEADPNFEDWDKIVNGYDEDESFTPFEVESCRESKYSFEALADIYFKNNYCPARNHVLSFVNNDLGNKNSQTDAVEGQFDSD